MQDGLKLMAERVSNRFNNGGKAFDYFGKKMLEGMLEAFSREKKVVYVSNYSFPSELLWAFDLAFFDFEIACNNMPQAMAGIGSQLMIPCENQGFSRDICSFHRMELSFLQNNTNPQGDFYICSSYYCHGKSKAHEMTAWREGKEFYHFEVPIKPTDCALAYVESQLMEITAKLEVLSGTKLDMGKLKENIQFSNLARRNMVKINEMMKQKPCPWDAMRATLLALGGSVFWGSPIMVNISKGLVREISDRINKGKARPERFRVLWSPWYPVQPTVIPSFLHDNQISMVMSEAADIWWSELDKDKPFESLAKKVLENYMLRNTPQRADRLLTLSREYDVDGIIHFGTTSCYHEYSAFRIIADTLNEEGYPVLDLDGDMTDERNYSQQRTLKKLDTFLEILKNKDRRSFQKQSD
jgi:benzoyl-CoA reductase/2-hydroxyglutaryl-CoA dehydratase subunit BcrC/BadD/HgdB